jgi:hypothetical protein
MLRLLRAFPNSGTGAVTSPRAGGRSILAGACSILAGGGSILAVDFTRRIVIIKTKKDV